jgi:hypothetical protein
MTKTDLNTKENLQKQRKVSRPSPRCQKTRKNPKYRFVFWDAECAEVIGKSAVQMRQMMLEVQIRHFSKYYFHLFSSHIL